MEPTTPAAQPSLSEPISDALAWTGRVLFNPFEARKWFLLAFCAFLADLDNVGPWNLNWNVGRSRDAGSPQALEALQDLWEDPVLLGVPAVVWVGAVVLLILGLVVLFTWLSSRGKFMFLDGVLRNRAAVADPWRELRVEARSLFGFCVVVALIALAAQLALLVPGIYLFFLLFTGSTDGGVGLVLALIVLWAILFVALAIAFSLIRLAVDDFIVPIMWLRRCRVMEAWDELRSVAAGRVKLLVLYVSMRLVIGIVRGLLAVILMMCTCCIATLPYIGTVIRLPLHVFVRSYSLGFLGRLGPDYAGLVPGAAPGSKPTSVEPPA